MPAVTVADPLTLPAIPTPDPATTTPRPVVSVTTAPSGVEGLGFPVRRAFAGVDAALLDPFVHMDQMGEVNYGPGEPKGTPWHPHRGFETVTYIIDGTFQHRDSAGGGGMISNGATQWMTAGKGILHIERPPEELVKSGGLFHGIQLWVNLPRAQKWVEPRYQDIGADRVTLLRSDDGGALVRVIAGEIAGHAGPGMTYTPITLAHATLASRLAAHAPVARRLQCARVRARRPRPGRRGATSDPDRSARRARSGRHRDRCRRRQAVDRRARPRRAAPRRTPDPRADRLVRARS